MNPKSFSASALGVAEACLSRYHAEWIERAPRYSTHTAGDLGTAVHLALENFVMFCVMNDVQPRTAETLTQLWNQAYLDTFDTADTATDEFLVGWDMLSNWFLRTSWDGVTVLSCEVKESFPVKVKFADGTVEEKPFNYIWDRADQIGEDEYKIVDYKTTMMPISPGDLKNKTQARIYGLAGQIKWPNAKRIFVEFDQLRHAPVGRVFTREDNIATWRFIQRSAQRIIDAVSDPTSGLYPETLNPDCRYCVRAATCATLNKNIDLDGIFAIRSVGEAMKLKMQIEARVSAQRNLLAELDDILLRHAENNDLMEWEEEGISARVTARATRTIDAERAAKVIGPKLMASFGKLNITEVDKMLKGDLITDAQKAQLKSLISPTMSDPKVKLVAKNPIDID